jgi:DNA-binding NtrC family response regulator
VARNDHNQRGGRTAVLLLVGSGSDLESLRSGTLVEIGEGADLGRRPIEIPGRVAVTLADRTVSGLHARIDRQSNGGYTVEDCGSTNGTLLDGRSFDGRLQLREGAILFFGSRTAVFRTVTDDELAALEADTRAPFSPVATRAPGLASAVAELRTLATTPVAVLLAGEIGAGQEIFANAVHLASGRRGRFVSIDCAAMPREQLAGELFGDGRKEGLIVGAQGGTLFLDDIGKVPPETQTALLRLVQDRTYSPVGVSKVLTADVRVVAAINAPAAEASSVVAPTLLTRLGRPIEIAPLRARPEDLGRLVVHFLARAGAALPLEPEAFQALLLYEWPHNVRELQRVMAEAELLSRGEALIGFDHLPTAIVEALERAGVADDVEGAAERSGDDDRAGLPGHPAAPTTRVRRPLPPPEELRSLMRRYGGNVTQVARHLGRQWAVIWRSLRRHGIDPESFRSGGGPRDRSN